jgi:hypothetical protein
MHYHEVATTVLPLTALLPLNCITQSLQNLYVEMTSNTLSKQYELIVHQTINVNELQKLSDCPPTFIYQDILYI